MGTRARARSRPRAARCARTRRSTRRPRGARGGTSPRRSRAAAATAGRGWTPRRAASRRARIGGERSTSASTPDDRSSAPHPAPAPPPPPAAAPAPRARLAPAHPHHRPSSAPTAPRPSPPARRAPSSGSPDASSSRAAPRPRHHHLLERTHHHHHRPERRRRLGVGPVVVAAALDAAASTARDAMIAAREAETLRRLADLEASGANLAVPRAEPSATPVEFRTPRGRVPSARGARTSIGTRSAYTTSARSHHPSGNHSEEASGSFGRPAKRFDRSFGGDLRECLGASGDLREGLGAGRRSDPGASGGAARRDAGDGMRKFLAKYGLERYAAFRPPRGHRS